MTIKRREPWQPVGVAIYHIVQFVANVTNYAPLTGGGGMPTEYEPEPEPRWMLCSSCGHSTVHLPYFWVMDGDTDWECDQCGAVSYG
jgi:hypothetical protein